MNMKNIIRNIFLGGAAAMMLLSCDMDLVPTGAIVYDPEKPLFLSEGDVADFQNGVMASYRSLHYGGHYYTGELMCDGFNAARGYGNNYGIIHKADQTFTPSNQEIEGVWASHYSAIKNYNIAIANADLAAEELQESASILKGIALFCRASSYLTLARNWGNAYDPATAETDLCVPLVTEYDQLAAPVRATVQDVYDQIILDLEEAESLLEEVPGEVRSQLPTIDAVHALMARYYLDVQDYDSAIDYAELVIKSEAGYKLASSEEAMHLEYTAEQGNEPIMQLYASKTEGLVANSYYLLANKDDNTKYFSPYYLPTKALVEAYEKTDLRFKNWFCLTDKAMTSAMLTATEKPVYPLKIEGSYHGGIYVFQKYRGNTTFIDGDVENGAHSAKTLLISEMYLIAAEAAARQGYDDTAKTYLNVIQKARQAVQTDGSLESVKKEWFRETVGQGMRLNCIKRWGDGIGKRTPQDGADNLVMTGPGFVDRVLEADAYVFTWPIPTYEIQITPSLPQNAGYISE